mmetsp:Transcript_20860/g.39799  ORF Transcript_20860/g.39799 Transcript_20860/m.39799 type:complete len:913 (-) Transcript_20860:141-2879(-)
MYSVYVKQRSSMSEDTPSRFGSAFLDGVSDVVSSASGYLLYPLLGSGNGDDSVVGRSKDTPKGDANHRLIFVPDLVFNFKAPEETDEEEEKTFRKRHLSAEKDHGSVFGEILNLHEIFMNNRHSAAEQEPAYSHEGHKSQSLKELRYHVIRMLYSFFQSFNGIELSEGKTVSSDHCQKSFVDVQLYTSYDSKEIFLAVKMNDHLSEVLADVAKMPVKLRPDKETFDQLGIKLPGEDMKNSAYVLFDIEHRNMYKLFVSPGGGGAKTTVLHSNRIRLLRDKTENFIDLTQLHKYGLLNTFYPGANNNNRAKSTKEWCSFRNPKVFLSLYQPIESIRLYYGELIGFYFLFTEFVLRSYLFLIPLAILTSICDRYDLLQLVFGAKDESDADPQITSKVGVLFYSVASMIWFWMLVRLWRRKEIETSNQWGMDFKPVVERADFAEPSNPFFHGDLLPSPLDNNIFHLQPRPGAQLWGSVTSYAVTVVYAIALVCLIFFTYWWKDRVQYTSDNSLFMVTILPIMLTAQIKIFDFVWDYLSSSTSSWEQHVTKYQFLQARSLKMLVMKVINSFTGFVYSGFVQPYNIYCLIGRQQDLKKCEENDQKARETMVLNLQTVFATYIIFSVVEMLQPYVTTQCKLSCEKRAKFKKLEAEKKQLEKMGSEAFHKLQRKLHRQPTGKRQHSILEDLQEKGAARVFYEPSVIEADSRKLEYGDDDLIYDYLEVVFPLAFTMFFSKYAPLSITILAFVTTMVKMRTSAWKMVWAHRRPFPERANGIGVWNAALSGIGFFSVAFNILPFIMQMETYVPMFPGLKEFRDQGGKIPVLIAIFMVLQNVFYITERTLEYLIPTKTEKLSLMKQQQALQRNRLMGKSLDNFQANILVDGGISDEAILEARHLNPQKEYYYVKDQDFGSVQH